MCLTCFVFVSAPVKSPFVEPLLKVHYINAPLRSTTLLSVCTERFTAHRYDGPSTTVITTNIIATI